MSALFAGLYRLPRSSMEGRRCTVQHACGMPRTEAVQALTRQMFASGGVGMAAVYVLADSGSELRLAETVDNGGPFLPAPGVHPDRSFLGRGGVPGRAAAVAGAPKRSLPTRSTSRSGPSLRRTGTVNRRCATARPDTAASGRTRPPAAPGRRRRTRPVPGGSGDTPHRPGGESGGTPHKPGESRGGVAHGLRGGAPHLPHASREDASARRTRRERGPGRGRRTRRGRCRGVRAMPGVRAVPGLVPGTRDRVRRDGDVSALRDVPEWSGGARAGPTAGHADPDGADPGPPIRRTAGRRARGAGGAAAGRRVQAARVPARRRPARCGLRRRPARPAGAVRRPDGRRPRSRGRPRAAGAHRTQPPHRAGPAAPARRRLRHDRAHRPHGGGRLRTRPARHRAGRVRRQRVDPAGAHRPRRPPGPHGDRRTGPGGRRPAAGLPYPQARRRAALAGSCAAGCRRTPAAPPPGCSGSSATPPTCGPASTTCPSYSGCRPRSPGRPPSGRSAASSSTPCVNRCAPTGSPSPNWRATGSWSPCSTRRSPTPGPSRGAPSGAPSGPTPPATPCPRWKAQAPRGPCQPVARRHRTRTGPGGHRPWRPRGAAAARGGQDGRRVPGRLGPGAPLRRGGTLAAHRDRRHGRSGPHACPRPGRGTRTGHDAPAQPAAPQTPRPRRRHRCGPLPSRDPRAGGRRRLVRRDPARRRARGAGHRRRAGPQRRSRDHHGPDAHRHPRLRGGGPPARRVVVAHANRLLVGMETDLFATCCYVDLDMEEGIAWVVRAGHLPPLLRLPDGTHAGDRRRRRPAARCPGGRRVPHDGVGTGPRHPARPRDRRAGRVLQPADGGGHAGGARPARRRGPGRPRARRGRAPRAPPPPRRRRGRPAAALRRHAGTAHPRPLGGVAAAGRRDARAPLHRAHPALLVRGRGARHGAAGGLRAGHQRRRPHAGEVRLDSRSPGTGSRIAVNDTSPRAPVRAASTDWEATGGRGSCSSRP